MSHDEYMRKFKRGTRKNFQRKLRLLQNESCGKLELVRIRSSDDVFGFLNAARAVAEESWQHQLIEIDVDQAADRQAFLESMAQQGLLRSYILKADGKAIAFELGFQLNEVFYDHEGAYDPAYAHFSPGQSLLNLVIEDCFKFDKPKTIFFGPGENLYKSTLSNQCGDEATIMIFRNTLANRAKLTVHHLFRKGIEMTKSGLARTMQMVQRRRDGM
jgi:CelD/BcsL family acetyltransferase involved in cellulose biosynthesis